MKSLKLILCLLLSLQALAQKTTTEYYNSKWLPCTESEAAYYRRYTKEGILYKVEDRTIDHRLLVEGHLDAISDNYASARQGKFTYYDKAGYSTREGEYLNGMQEGKWIFYAGGSRTVNYEIFYHNGLIERRRDYTLRSHLIESDMTYKLGKPEGGLKYTYYDSSEQLMEVKEVINNTSVPRHCYNRKGIEIDCKELKRPAEIFKFVEQMPSPTFNMMTYLQQNIVYPPLAQKSKIGGRVSVVFTVNEDGSIENVHVSQGVFPDIDEEAVRVIATMPKWLPGKQNGKLVKVQYTQPITFTIADK